MHHVGKNIVMILLGVCVATLLSGATLLHSGNPKTTYQAPVPRTPILIAHLGGAPMLDRPPVVFDHDRHTVALKSRKAEDCAVCHTLKEADPRVADPQVRVFKFPKTAFDGTDKTALMCAYHNECVGCHRKMASEGKKTGPDIGLCGKCHPKRPGIAEVSWAWQPVFNYARHAGHVQAVGQIGPAEDLNIAGKLDVIGKPGEKRCEWCHHTYSAEKKRLEYKKDTENSCRACHKAEGDKNARSMRKVAHAACIGCHMTLAEKVNAEVARTGRTELTAQDKKRFGPLECSGCHGEHKELTPDEIAKVPRLVRGQKDVMDISLVAATELGAPSVPPGSPDSVPTVRMKAVPFNHKSHEVRAQFCNTCHHHSLEKCTNCHTVQGDPKKGGAVTYERAFHTSKGRQSCVGCHSSAKQDKKCAGCHQWMTVDMPKSSCPVCHRGSSGGQPTDVAPIALYQDKEKVPEKVQLKGLEKEFKPAEIPHLKIVNRLVTLSNENSLARWFHAPKDQALCSGCHHRSDLPQATVAVPKCVACHNRPFDPNALGRPGLMGAYHRQCIGCHEAMKQKPTALECAKCHPERDSVHTAGLIPPVHGNR